MLRFTSVPLVIALAAAFGAPTAADAKVKYHTIHHRHFYPVPVADYGVRQPPLTVNRRSWLDPGPVVPVGSMQRYVEGATVLNLTQDQMVTDRFGNGTLPRRFDPPGKPGPVFEFWTPRGD
jgi:hypothetical protein